MRELTRIQVFTPEPAKGYGFDDETAAMLDDAGGFTWGDSRHPNLPETGGKYDGRYLYVNDMTLRAPAFRTTWWGFSPGSRSDGPVLDGDKAGSSWQLWSRTRIDPGKGRPSVPEEGRSDASVLRVPRLGRTTSLWLGRAAGASASPSVCATTALAIRWA